MYIFSENTWLFTISLIVVVVLAVRHFRRKCELTFWQYNYRGTIYGLLLVYLFISSFTWWRFNVSINTLHSGQGCVVRHFSRGGVHLINNGVKTGYAVGPNRKGDPVITWRDLKKGDCYKIKYYSQFDVQYLYSIEKINESKEVN